MGLLSRRRESNVNESVQTDASALVETRSRLAVVELELGRAQAALDSLPLGVVLVDPKGSVISRNAAATPARGHADVLLQGAISRLVSQALGGVPSQSSVELFGPPKRVLQVSAAPLPDGGVLATVEDVSDRSRLDAVRTDFVANISHELKTPVSALAVLAEALADEDDLPIMRRLAGKMVDEAHRAATVIDDLLELSRIELGGMAVRDRVDVATLLSDAAVRSLAGAEQRNIRIDVDEPVELAVLGDRRQLVSALSNLIDNAVKFSSQGPVTLRVQPIETQGEWLWVRFEVQDQGPGIASELQARIFEPFFTTREKGTGLGLPLARKLVEAHRGTLTLESRPGQTVFRLSLPTR